LRAAQFPGTRRESTVQRKAIAINRSTGRRAPRTSPRIAPSPESDRLERRRRVPDLARRRRKNAEVAKTNDGQKRRACRSRRNNREPKSAAAKFAAALAAHVILVAAD